MKRNKRRILALLLALLLMGMTIVPALAAESGSAEIHLRTAQDLVAFSQNCALDSWSVGKTVYLDADIDLGGTAFQPIPTFSGTFYGQGHTISGFSLSGSGDNRGFFRYVQSAATIQNLTVSGAVTPSDRKDSIGGLVGVNRGTLLNCAFQGDVKGGTNVGGVVGYNKSTGQLINCTYSGILLGEHYAGGIVGLNEGSVIRCQNDGSVNLTEVKTAVELHDVTLSTIRSTETVPACTDIGGIAGASSGILQSCTNNGDVGYEHVGYNVGGIAGRQSGWLDSCVNNGTIRGRKDVGGICGQMEPRLTLLFDTDFLDELWSELDTLQALMDKAISDSQRTSDAIAGQITGISDRADAVREAVSGLSDSMTDWTDQNIETVNDIAARISWTMDRLEPIADQTDAALEQIRDAVQYAEEALDELDWAGDVSQAAAEDLRLGLDRVSRAAALGSEAMDQLRDAIEMLQDGLGDSGVMAQALDQVRTALDRLTRSFEQLSDGFEQLGDALWDVLQELHTQIVTPPAEDEDPAQPEEGEPDSSDPAQPEEGEQDSSNPTQPEEGEQDSSDPTQPEEGDQDSSDPAQPEAGDQEGQKESASAPDSASSFTWGETELDWSGVLAALADMSQSADQIKEGLGLLCRTIGGVGDTAVGLFEATLEDITTAAGTLQDGFQMMDRAAGHMEDALDDLDLAARYGERAADRLRDAAGALGDACDQLRQAGNTFSGVMEELADMPEIIFTPVGDAVHEKRDVLDQAMGGLSEAVQGMNETMSASSDLLLSDIQAINDQFGKVVDVFQRQTDSEKEEAGQDEELLEDVSDQATETDEDAGRITNARNLGTVEGDVNVAGIVGSMAIEYDYDPEDDLTTSGDRSLNFRYQAAALTEACVNNGEVTGKKDYVGGIVGRMDLGTVSQCESYAPVESTGGDYVGGIAGAAWSTIRSCWSRCALSGNDYIGGVAGLGKTVTDCRSLVEIDGGAAYLGAILGDVEEDGAVSRNLFIHHTLNGIDGISYQGQAEPVDFETLSQNAPSAFTQFCLVFTADGQVVDTFDFSYGDALDKLPDIPEKEGYSASWPDIDYGCLTFSRTLEAEYQAYSSALTALGDPPKLVAEGTFSSGSALSASSKEEVWTDAYGASHLSAVYTAAVTDPTQPVTAFQLQYKLSDDAVDGIVWVKTSQGWEERDAERDGTYLVFQAEGDTITFTVQEQTANPLIWILASAIGIAVSGILVFLWRRRKTKGVNKTRKRDHT